MAVTYLGLGANMQDKIRMLNRARILLNIYAGAVIKASKLYSTEPWGYEEQDEFVNQVLCINTNLSPEDLHTATLKIEAHLGKKKENSKYGPRNIDIDILLYEQECSDTTSLKIPHARMHERNFVLIPLAEIAPEAIHPVFQVSISHLLERSEDNGSVIPYEFKH